jgi:hypothetical protein
VKPASAKATTITKVQMYFLMARRPAVELVRIRTGVNAPRSRCNEVAVRSRLSLPFLSVGGGQQTEGTDPDPSAGLRNGGHPSCPVELSVDTIISKPMRRSSLRSKRCAPHALGHFRVAGSAVRKIPGHKCTGAFSWRPLLRIQRAAVTGSDAPGGAVEVIDERGRRVPLPPNGPDVRAGEGGNANKAILVSEQQRSRNRFRLGSGCKALPGSGRRISSALEPRGTPACPRRGWGRPG